MNCRLVLGIDVGSTSLSAAALTTATEIVTTFSVPHEGNVKRALQQLDQHLDSKCAGAALHGCAITGSLGAALRCDLVVDSRIATIRSVRERFPAARNVLLVGGEQFCLIRFDAGGNYHGIRTNTSCAAGTGGFLDQQAVRLGLADSAELSRIALANSDPVPAVATRCSVFAKTDLIHAQQEGYSLSSISEGLCSGLAHNIVDTVFKEPDLTGQVLVTGGVAQNEAVVRAIRTLVANEVIADRYGSAQGAIGAALTLIDRAAVRLPAIESVAALFHGRPPDRGSFFAPLSLQQSEFPDFSAHQRYEFAARPGGAKREQMVEVDIYRNWPGLLDAYLGIDIGSTSTKAVITALDGGVLGGFYTRTAGRPLEAVQSLFQAVEQTAKDQGCALRIHGTGTTGSGRRFVGALVRADEIMDEISAHARAACEINAAVDTIIEIGGQDAKFTTLQNGRVTFSAMNNVCAAGTGSFLEEQAKRLGVTVGDYEALTEGVRAPLVSDRCTVFMDRDINYLLAGGHSVPELLAAAVHAVRENYLHKVAVEKQIGSVVMFQGATAKNRSLVAAFEQRLDRPIHVSPWCHLTGALGSALALKDAGVMSQRFVGLSFWRRRVPLRREVCTYCTNHCKLTVAQIDGGSVAFGFLCGRDYCDTGYVNRNRSGFDLLRERRRVERQAAAEPNRVDAEANGMSDSGASRVARRVVGLPDALFMSEDLSYWEFFFRCLGIPTRTSRGLKDAARRGKTRSGAEFCAPVSAWHGHAEALLEQCDYLFLPTALEESGGPNGERRKYCYVTQFASSLIAQGVCRERVIAPLVGRRYTVLQRVGELHRALSVLPGESIGLRRVAQALEAADAFRERRRRALQQLYLENRGDGSRVEVVLLGRPYTVLPPAMNKGIPDLFAAMGVRVFYQDMLDLSAAEGSPIAPLLQELNWSYGRAVLQAAQVAAETPGLYPVMVTSFKCGPDSFVGDYFRRIMEAHDKPYLILELDDHDSRVGYETRVEAALRAFNNHREQRHRLSRSTETSSAASYHGINPGYLRKLSHDRTLILPNWDNYAIPLIAAILRSQGYPALVMEETDETIRRSLRWNNGQCIPMNALVEGFADTVRTHGISPARSALWVPTADFSCNIRLFPHHIQEILRQYPGLEQASVYLGNMTFIDLSPVITANAYLAYMFSGLIRRIACRIRPYERQAGQTNRAVEASLAILRSVFEDNGKSKTDAIDKITALFDAIDYDDTVRRPKVALFGDVYVRDNDVMNQDVIDYIERNGGEVVTMPFHEFTRMTSNVYFRRWVRDLRLGRLLALKPMMAAMAQMERWYYRRLERVVRQPLPRFAENPAQILGRFHVRLEHEGESQDNLMKTWYIKQQHPDLALFVQLNPAFCCAGLVTEAMSPAIREITGVPVLSITYDGIGGLKNDAILPYLQYSAERSAHGEGQAGVREFPVA